MSSPSGLYSRVPHDARGNQVTISELFRADVLQVDDVFHLDKCVEAHGGGHFRLLVDADAVIRAPGKTAPRGGTVAIDFDILENGQRRSLGTFTGLKSLAEALVRTVGGLPASVTITSLSRPWDDFQIWRNELCLGTAAEVRNHYWITHKRDSAPPTTRDNPSHVATVANIAPALSDSLSNPNLALRPLPSQPPTSLPTHTKSARRGEKLSDAALDDTLMRELFDAIHPAYRPERYNKKHTAIRAKDYIQFLERRIDQTCRMITIMGVSRQSLSNIIRQMNDGVDVADAMRRALEWDDEEAPLGNPLGLYDPVKQKFHDEYRGVEDAE